MPYSIPGTWYPSIRMYRSEPNGYFSRMPLYPVIWFVPTLRVFVFRCAGLDQTVVLAACPHILSFASRPRCALLFFSAHARRARYHTAPGSKRLRRASEVSAAEKGDLSRPLSSIPELGVFAQQRLKLMVVLTNPAALDAVARVRGV